MQTQIFFQCLDNDTWRAIQPSIFRGDFNPTQVWSKLGQANDNILLLLDYSGESSKVVYERCVKVIHSSIIKGLNTPDRITANYNITTIKQWTILNESTNVPLVKVLSIVTDFTNE